MFVDVVINRPTHRYPPAGSDPLRSDTSLFKTYTYRLPESLRDVVAMGHLVQVPLRTSTTIGIVVSLADAPPSGLDPEDIRDVAALLDPLPAVTPTQIELARWIAARTLSPLSQCMRLMLPPGLEGRTILVISQMADYDPEALTEQERAALELLQGEGSRRSLPLTTLLSRLPGHDPEAVVDSLADRGLLEAHYALVPPVPAPPRIQYVRLLADEATLTSALPRLGRASKQADLLLALARRGDAPVALDELCERVGCREGPVQALARRGWVQIAKGRTLVVALSQEAEAAGDRLKRAPKQQAVLAALRHRSGPVDPGELLKETGASPAVLAALEAKGLAQRVSDPPHVLLGLPTSEVLDAVIELRGAQKERAVLESLRSSAGRVWVGGIYAQTGANLSTLRRLAEQGLVSLHSEEYERPPPGDLAVPLRLTADQEVVLRAVERGLEPAGAGQPSTLLLHGVTGSGKTEVYLQALDRVLAHGQRAVILVPEVSLTAQTVRRFEARFPGRIVVMHSQLSAGNRYAAWDRVRRGDVDVVIGPRSALFAPLTRLGLIVIDEAHDGSYKQDEPIPLPSYHARSVAAALSRLTGAVLLMGSATPDLVTYYHAKQGDYGLLALPQRIVSRGPGTDPQVAHLPPVRVVDMRQELRAGNRSIFSRKLQASLRRTLEAGEQAILFLNRRGAATFVLCRDCGYVVRCPRCEVPLTLHLYGGPAGSGRLVCHRCNYHEVRPDRCPECRGRRIRFFGLGTERVEAEAQRLHPAARLLRWDRDTATGADHERYLQAFVEHRADLLVGTQMIAKGLDLPLVTLVGVIMADTALNLPDYRAAERTFQLVTQVAGRAGRSRRGGQVVIQTYNPDHYALRTAAGHDFARFYEEELACRQKLGYPPFSRLVALRYSHEDPRRARTEAERLGRWLIQEIRRLDLSLDLIGPAPCFFSRLKGRHRWQIVVRGRDPCAVLQDVALPRDWRVDVDPESLL